ncbi:MAG: hypothetical protein ACK55Z_00770 [bacterium]
MRYRTDQPAQATKGLNKPVRDDGIWAGLETEHAANQYSHLSLLEKKAELRMKR